MLCMAALISFGIFSFQKASAARGPLTRSASVDGSSKGGSSLQRQTSLPDYHLPTSYSAGHALEVIQVRC